MKTVRTLLIVVVVIALAAIAFVFSGIYDVAASSPEPGLVRAVLVQAREHSIERHAAGIHPPADLDDPRRIREGFEHYHEMCTTCHGAPGVAVSEIGQGLNPEPPELASSNDAGEEAASFFWIVKNGIKMTGMPAFGVTHNDDQIWSIIAFLRRMPKLTPQEYQDMARQAGLIAPASEAAPEMPNMEHPLNPAAGAPAPNTKHPLNPNPPPG
jgi:mono/diheme cytochrome c family protein